MTHSNAAASGPDKPNARKPWWKLSLPMWIMIGVVIGGVFGFLFPNYTDASGKVHEGLGSQVQFLRTIFINLIKLVIGPLVFASVVAGIAGEANLKKVGRMGVKSFIYFEVVTTLALVVGLLVVNVLQPGTRGGGLTPPAGATTMAAVPNTVAAAKAQTLTETIVHIFPSSFADALVRNDVLQIVAFAVLFGIAVVTLGQAARPIIVWCESLSQVMFRFTSIVMLFAPIGVGAAMSHAIAEHGLKVLVDLGWLVGTLYFALIVFVVFVLGAIVLLFRVPLRPFFRAVKEPFAVAFATTSSESALPKAMENMQRLGVPKRIVSFVMPTGYTFNLDGTTLYLAVAALFAAQAGGMHMSVTEQVIMMLTLMVTSKGVAGVPRASYVILLATATQFKLPMVAILLIPSVDEFMDMARTSVNVLGNCLATVVIGRWEGEFDDKKAKVFGTPAEVPLEIQEGEPALAIDAAKGH